MAKLHNKVPASGLLLSIKAFLSTCRTPAVLEEGDTAIALTPGAYSIEIRSGRLCLEAATDSRLLSRHLLSVTQHRPGILDCTFQRFGGTEGRISFLDLDRPQTGHRQLTASRRSFGEQFRRMLRRQFPQWEIATLSSSMDLRRSFSPVFPRATLSRGNQVVAAVACPSAEHESKFLTFALLWFDYVCRSQRGVRLSLCLFLPDGVGCLTAHRLRWLRSEALAPRLFLFNEHGSAGEVDPQDLGNLNTRVGSQRAEAHLSGALRSLVESLSDFPHVSAIAELSGEISIRFQGVEFARIRDNRLLLGFADQDEVSGPDFDGVRGFVLQLLSLSKAPSSPERWLEGALRANLQSVDATLLPAPVHGQVLTFAGRDRDAIDLLAISPDGRLTVLELKACEDLHLPLQALDYWMRVKWHLERQELGHLFPAIPLSIRPPRLLLVAPALSFHSANATVLRYFSPEVEVERIGVNSDWQTRVRVVLRLTGADTPISHGRFYGNPGPD